MTSAALIAAPASTDAPILHVLFKVDGADYAFSADVVLQMESYSGATVVPGTKPFVAGIIQLRGRVVPVVDLRVRFGLPARAPALETRVVVCEHGGRTVAFVADSAREVIRLAASQIKPPPRLVDADAHGFVKAVAQVGERTIMILEFARLVSEEPTDV